MHCTTVKRIKKPLSWHVWISGAAWPYNRCRQLERTGHILRSPIWVYKPGNRTLNTDACKWNFVLKKRTTKYTERCNQAKDDERWPERLTWFKRLWDGVRWLPSVTGVPVEMWSCRWDSDSNEQTSVTRLYQKILN